MHVFSSQSFAYLCIQKYFQNFVIQAEDIVVIETNRVPALLENILKCQ